MTNRELLKLNSEKLEEIQKEQQTLYNKEEFIQGERSKILAAIIFEEKLFQKVKWELEHWGNCIQLATRTEKCVEILDLIAPMNYHGQFEMGDGFIFRYDDSEICIRIEAGSCLKLSDFIKKHGLQIVANKSLQKVYKEREELQVKISTLEQLQREIDG